MSTEGEYLPPLVTKLTADTSDLMEGFAQAKAAKEQFERDMSETDAALRRTAAESSKTSQAVAELGHESESTAQRTGRASRKAREELKQTDDALAASMRRFRTDTREGARANDEFSRLVVKNMKMGETAVSALRREHKRLTDDLEHAKRMLGGAFSTRNDYGRVTDLKRDLGKVVDIGKDLGVEFGQQASKSFVSSVSGAIGNGLDTLGPVGAAIGAAIVVAIVVAAPAIGAAIAAALALGLGAGVIGLGAMILKDDKDIQKAAAKLGKTTSTVFEKAAQPMKKPFIKVLGFIEKESKKLQKPLTEVFAAAAPLVQPVGEGLMGLLKNALPGITAALINAKPAFDALGQNMPLIGTAIGYFFQTITENKDDLAYFVTEGTQLLAGLIMILGDVISWLLHAYRKMSEFASNVRTGLSAATAVIKGWFDSTIGWVYDMATAIGHALGLGLEHGIHKDIPRVGGAAAELAGVAITAAAKKLQTHSPSRVFEHMGRMSGEGYALGIMRSADRAQQATADMVGIGRQQRAGLGYDAALALSRPAPSYAAVAGGGQPIVLTLDGRVLARGLVPHSQRAASRNGGVSGLGNVAVV